MRTDFDHLAGTFRNILKDILPEEDPRTATVLATVPARWVLQLAETIGDGEMPAMARDEAVRVTPETLRVEVRVRSLNGTVAVVTLRYDRDERRAMPAHLSSVGKPGRAIESPAPPAARVAVIFGSGPRERMVENAFVQSFLDRMPAMSYRALGDGIVEVDVPRSRDGVPDPDALREVVDIANATGTTLALPIATAGGVEKLGFVSDGRRWLRRPPKAVPGIVTAPGLPLWMDFTAIERDGPDDGAGPEAADTDRIGYPEIEEAVGVLNRLAGSTGRNLASSLSEVVTAARSGGTDKARAEMLRSVTFKHTKAVWTSLYVVPLMRVRGNDLARAVGSALPALAKAPDLEPALEAMRAMVPDIPKGTSAAGVAEEAVRFLGASMVVRRYLDRLNLLPLQRRALEWLEPGKAQGDPLQLRHRAVFHFAELAKTLGDSTIVPYARAGLTWAMASLPGVGILGFDRNVDGSREGAVRVDLEMKGKRLGVEARKDGTGSRVEAWIEGPEGRERVRVGDDLAPLFGLGNAVSEDAASRMLQLAAESKGYGIGVMVIPKGEDEALVVAVPDTRRPGRTSLDFLFREADGLGVTLRTQDEAFIPEHRRTEFRRTAGDYAAGLVREPARTPAPAPGWGRH